MEIVILIVIFGLIFDYTNGFHDAANVVSTVIATRVLAPLSAIVMAGVLNFIGATQISGVAQTIATGLVDAREATQVVVLAAVLAAWEERSGTHTWRNPGGWDLGAYHGRLRCSRTIRRQNDSFFETPRTWHAHLLS